MKILLRPKRSKASDLVELRPTVRATIRPTRVLHFDVEARPLSWIAADYVSKEITAIAWAWSDKPEEVSCYQLGLDRPEEFLAKFLEEYAKADMGSGHYARGYDCPVINGALMELRMPVLPDKAISDTKLDLTRSSGVSLSQESLGAMYRLEHQKVVMNQARWRAANRLTPEGLAAVRERVVGDVRQHIQLRAELQRLGYLAAPKVWRSGAARTEEYTP